MTIRMYVLNECINDIVVGSERKRSKRRKRMTLLYQINSSKRLEHRTGKTEALERKTRVMIREGEADMSYKTTPVGSWPAQRRAGRVVERGKKAWQTGGFA